VIFGFPNKESMSSFKEKKVQEKKNTETGVKVKIGRATSFQSYLQK
jgi:hypothetical protein